MSWVKIDDGFVEHNKVLGLSDRSFRLYVAALCYCARNMTDGSLDKRAVLIVSAVVSRSKTSHFRELVAAGLLIETACGYDVNDYLTYNPSATQAKEAREKAADRKRRSRSGHAVTADVTAAVTADVTPRAHVPVPSPALSEKEAAEHDAAAGLTILLQALGVTDPGLILAAHQDPERARVCAAKAAADAKTNPGGLFRVLLESGETPVIPPEPLTAEARIRRLIANGVIADHVDLEAELRAFPLTPSWAVRVRALLPQSGAVAR